MNRPNLNLKKHRNRDWMAPGPIFLAIFFLGIIMPISPFLEFRDSFSIIWPFSFYNKIQTTIHSFLIYLSASVFFFIGYRYSLSKEASRKILIINDRNFINVLLTLSVVGIASFLLISFLVGGISNILQGSSDRTRAFAGIQGLFILMNVLCSACLVWFIRLVKNGRSIFEITMFILYLLFSLFLISFQGQKSNIFILIATLALIYNLRVKRIRPEIIVLSIILCFIILMAYHIYKQEYLVLGRVVSVSGGDQFWSSLYEFLNQQVSGNFMQLQTMSVLIEGMPLPLDYQYGYTYLAGLLLLVPRSIFPDKPLPSTGIFTEAFWPAAWRELGTTLPPGLFGEAYMNFGVYGALGMGLLSGYIIGRLHKNFITENQNDMALIYYAVMVSSMLHFFRGELASVTYLYLSIAIPCRMFMKKT